MKKMQLISTYRHCPLKTLHAFKSRTDRPLDRLKKYKMNKTNILKPKMSDFFI